MKIALISDIHANLPALEAALIDIEARKPDAIYCLGDLVGYNIWPNEVIDHIRKRGIATLAGNHDLKVVPGTGSHNAETEGKPGKNYGYEIVGEDEKEYLMTLPAHIRLEFQIKGEKMNLLLVHGSPRSVNEYLLADMEEAQIRAIMHEASADILCFGHSHKPYHRVIAITEGEQTLYWHAINIGSIGKPKDGDARGCYVILHLHQNSSLSVASSMQVEFIRVAYDVEKAARAVEDSPLPNELADMLRKAY